MPNEQERVRYCGKKLTDMSREELIDAVVYFIDYIKQQEEVDDKIQRFNDWSRKQRNAVVW